MQADLRLGWSHIVVNLMLRLKGSEIVAFPVHTYPFLSFRDKDLGAKFKCAIKLV